MSQSSNSKWAAQAMLSFTQQRAIAAAARLWSLQFGRLSNSAVL